MAVSKKIGEAMTRSSWIRRMFEEGEALRADGKGPVFDFSLGNPCLEPPGEFAKRLSELVLSPPPGMHRYMANIGHESTRRAVAAYVRDEFKVAVTHDHVVMTVGAGGGCNVALKAVLDPGDEVMVLTPFFVEYAFYIDNHGGTMVRVPAGDDFGIDHEAIARAITPRTKAMIINSPNNPTGVVYSRESLGRLAALLREKGIEMGRTIYLISDEPYRKICYDTQHCPGALDVYEHSIMITSHSKDLGLAGERIGWIVVHPEADDAESVHGAMAFLNRTLGFVNAPSLMQKAIETCLRSSVDVDWYRRKRDVLCDRLAAFGYDLVRPGGAFYVFPKAPGGDDVAFCQLMLKRHRVLVVPGSGFGAPGFFRLSYCVEDSVVETALPAFEQAIKEYQ